MSMIHDTYEQSQGGQLSRADWDRISHGGRSGSTTHRAIQNSLVNREGSTLSAEVRFGDRYADAAGPGEIHQIGGVNRRGDPIARERDAINGIINSPEYNGETIYFWDRTNPAAAPIVNPQLQPTYGARP